MLVAEQDNPPAQKTICIDKDLCLGCGVCALKCCSGAIQLHKREQRVLHPENVFEKIILSALERGTLHYQLFADPSRLSHRFMRHLLGGFCRLPQVKKILMSDQLRSRFLKSVKLGARLQGMGWMTEL